MDNKKKKKFPYIRLVVAAIILFLIGMMINKIINRDNHKTISLNELENYIRHEATRNTLNNTLLTSSQQKAYNTFTLREFRDAKPLLNGLWQSERDTLALYYLGITHWYNDDIQKAKEVLELPFFSEYKKPY